MGEDSRGSDTRASGTRASDTRARLLAAARVQFAAHGIAGARVDRIAAEAGVNKERIYGHFGSKEALFVAVLTDALEELAATVALPDADDDLAAYVGRVFDFHREHPELLRLLLWEGLTFGAHPPQIERRLPHYRDKVRALTDRPLPQHPAVVLLVLIGLGAWPHAVPQLSRLIVGENVDTDEGAGRLRDGLVAMAAAMLASGTGA